eukprot:Lankesteria_metandrocarpae@DN733_c0_g1_i1.p1
MTNRESQTCVWVGNIPYDVTEDELRDVMQSVGHVSSLRIRYDKDTGQSRGFAFCEYRDSETCAIAIRKIGGTELRGRALRVDWATAEMKQRYQTSSLVGNGGSGRQEPRGERRPQRPQHAGSTAKIAVDSGEGLSVTAEICQIVNSMSAAELLYLVAHMQKLVLEAPDIARSLLTENPQLCYALLHVEFLLGIVNDHLVPFTSDTDYRIAQEFRAARLEEAGTIYDCAFVARNTPTTYSMATSTTQQTHPRSCNYPGEHSSPHQRPVDVDMSRNTPESNRGPALQYENAAKIVNSESTQPPPSNQTEHDTSASFSTVAGFGDAQQLSMGPKNSQDFPAEALGAAVHAEPDISAAPFNSSLLTSESRSNPLGQGKIAKEDLLEQLLKVENPQFIEGLLTVDANSEGNWSPDERRQIVAIQEALKARMGTEPETTI